MGDLIRKSQVLNRLNFMKTETEMNHKTPVTKRRALIGCIDEILEQVQAIDPVDEPEPEAVQPETETDESTEEQEEKPVVTFPKDKFLEPIMTGSQIGIERYRCRRCKTVVDKQDLFCKHCGSKFGDIVEHKSTRWDTVRKCLVGREAG